MAWERVELGSVALIKAGGKSGQSGLNFVQEGYPAFGAGGLNGMLPGWEFEDGAVVLSSIGARCGKSFFPTGRWTSLANTQLIFPDPKKVDRKFLWYLLNDESRWHRSGTAQPYIKPSDVRSNLIPLPPLPEQRRIASILDSVDSLRNTRKRVFTFLEQVQAEILSRTLSEELPECELGEIFRVTGGKRLPKGAPYADVATTQAYLRVSDMKDGEFALDDLKYLTHEVQLQISRYVVAEGDLVISIAGSIGIVSRVPAELSGSNLTENAARLRPRDPENTLGDLYRSQLASPQIQAQIRAATGQVTIGKLALFRIEKLRVKVPSIAQQKNFEAKASTLRLVTSLCEVHLAKLDELFASLQHRAFSGQL